MTNSDKYKTAKDRVKAFWKNYKEYSLAYDAIEAFADWLDLEATAEEPLPCPFCGKGTMVMHTNTTVYSVWCNDCDYQSMQFDSESAAIAAHNRVARAVAEAKEDD